MGWRQVGGGCGLELGKERVRKMIQSFGGKVTGSVSGRTDILVVGKQPGFSKVPSCYPLTHVTTLTHTSLVSKTVHPSLLVR